MRFDHAAHAAEREVGTVAASGYQARVSRSSDGRVWFAIDGGLSVTDPTLVVRNRVAPPAHVEEVLVDNESVRTRGPVEAPPGTTNFVFHYAGPQLPRSGKVWFQVPITLAPHLYQTSWFYALTIAIGAFAIVGTHALRVQRLRLRGEVLERLVDHAPRSCRTRRRSSASSSTSMPRVGA